MNICITHQQQYTDGGYCAYCGPAKPALQQHTVGTSGFGPLHEVEGPKYPGSIDGDPTELDRLRDESARLKAAVDEARPFVRASQCACHFCDDKCYRCKWLAANPGGK